MIRTLSFLLLLAGAACSTQLAQAPALPPPPQGLRAVAVAAPTNATGHDLKVNDEGIFAAITDERKTTTVQQLLEDDLRRALNSRDFRVIAPDKGGAPVLRTDIRRWQPLSSTYEQVTVDISAKLVDPQTGATLWTMDRSSWIVPTGGSHNEIDATTKASAKVAEEIVAGWQVAAAPPAP